MTWRPRCVWFVASGDLFVVEIGRCHTYFLSLSALIEDIGAPFFRTRNQRVLDPRMASSPERAPSLLDDVLTKLSTLPGRRRLFLCPNRERRQQPPSFLMHPKSKACKWLSKEVLLLIADSKDTQQTQTRPQSNPATSNPGAYVAAEANLYIFPTTHAVIVLHLNGRHDG